MTSARERQEWVEGYEAPIKRALWERIAASACRVLWATLWMSVSVCRAPRHGGLGV